jgi:hypothetical protein
VTLCQLALAQAGRWTTAAGFQQLEASMTAKSNKEGQVSGTTCPSTWPEKALLGATTEVEANTRHGIRHVPGKGRDLFHSLDEIVPAFEEVARKAYIRIGSAKARWR